MLSTTAARFAARVTRTRNAGKPYDGCGHLNTECRESSVLDSLRAARRLAGTDAVTRRSRTILLCHRRAHATDATASRYCRSKLLPRRTKPTERPSVPPPERSARLSHYVPTLSRPLILVLKPEHPRLSSEKAHLQGDTKPAGLRVRPTAP